MIRDQPKCQSDRHRPASGVSTLWALGWASCSTSFKVFFPWSVLSRIARYAVVHVTHKPTRNDVYLNVFDWPFEHEVVLHGYIAFLGLPLCCCFFLPGQASLKWILKEFFFTQGQNHICTVKSSHNLWKIIFCPWVAQILLASSSSLKLDGWYPGVMFQLFRRHDERSHRRGITLSNESQ